MESAKDVAKSVEDCCHTCKNVCHDEPSLRELGQSAADVTRALNDLLNHVKDGHADRIPDIMEQIMTASGELIGSYDSAEMVKQARVLAQSTAELIQAIKGEAETQSDSELQVNNSAYSIYLPLDKRFVVNVGRNTLYKTSFKKQETVKYSHVVLLHSYKNGFLFRLKELHKFSHQILTYHPGISMFLYPTIFKL